MPFRHLPSSPVSISIAGLIVALAVIASTAASAQTTVFSDDFSDRNRDGWYIANSEPSKEGAAARTVDVSKGYLETVSGGYGFWGVVANFPAVNLRSVDDSIELTMKYQILEDLEAKVITMGLWDSQGTRLTSDSTDIGVAADDSGYYVYNGGNATKPRYWLKAGYNTGLGSLNGSVTLRNGGANPYVSADSTWHTFSLKITKTDQGILVVTSIDGAFGTSALDTSGNIASFDQVAIQAVTQDFAIDDVKVDIPEPATLAFVWFVGVVALGARRRLGRQLASGHS